MNLVTKKLSVLVLGMVVLCMAGCKSESRIDDVPVSEIEPSTPPVVSEPVKLDPVQGADGVFKISDKRYFNAVVPFGATEVTCTEDDCRCFVPRMNQEDVIRFIDKYFPYQEHGIYRKVDMFEVYPKIKPEFADDSIIPSMDPNVIKPTADTAVEIHVFRNKREKRYEWTYIDPLKRVRDRERDEAVLAQMRAEAEAYESAHQVKPSDDSEGEMMKADVRDK